MGIRWEDYRQNEFLHDFTTLDRCDIYFKLKLDMDSSKLFWRPDKLGPATRSDPNLYFDLTIISQTSEYFQQQSLDMKIENCHYNWLASGNNKKVRNNDIMEFLL